MSDYVLYVVVNNTLKSMNNGKAQAHSGHAASQFGHRILTDPSHPLRSSYFEWAGDRGFGTQMNMRPKKHTNFYEVGEHAFDDDYYMAGVVIDPTYPYDVDEETYDLIDPSIHTLAAKHIPQKKIYRCFREQTTAAYFFINATYEFEINRFLKNNLELCP